MAEPPLLVVKEFTFGTGFVTLDAIYDAKLLVPLHHGVLRLADEVSPLVMRGPIPLIRDDDALLTHSYPPT